MTFLIADTFTDSLARLTGDEQKAAKTTAFDLQIDPTNPGMSFHRLDRAKDKNFWSVRVSRDIRIIVHKTPESLLLCYVDHHDKAYSWAERRKLERHPTTGAAQIVEIRESVQEIFVPVYIEEEQPKVEKPPALASVADEDLLKYGVPEEWIRDLKAASEDALLLLVERLPAEAAEAVLELATGGQPRQPVLLEASANPFEHPEAQRRFRVVENLEELQRALEYPWEKWSIFLHPEQRQWVERSYNGPARVSGSAGTGKTIVALHRAVQLARANLDARILLTTFSEVLANSLRVKLRRLIGNEPKLGERIDVLGLESLGLRLYKARLGPVELVNRETIRSLLQKAAQEAPNQSFSQTFLLAEWEHVVDAWQIVSWEQYRIFSRLGRKIRLSETQRSTLWSIFESVRSSLAQQSLTTLPAVFTRLAETITASNNPPFDFAVIDEAQDLSVSQLKFFAALGGNQPEALFFAGDIGQRIFQQPFSWLSLGVDIRGRSRTLRVNYRTSHQIRAQADRLLDPEISDADGNRENRRDTVSIFNGQAPQIRTYPTSEGETTAVSNWLTNLIAEGFAPHEIGVFVRSEAELARAQAAIEQASLTALVLDGSNGARSGSVTLSPMHLAKGLEFRAVVAMACDEEIIPLQSRIEAVGDGGDLQEIYDTERHLLYVACTRARDRLLITGVEPGSDFLVDLVN